MRSSDIRAVRLARKRGGLLGLASEGFPIGEVDAFLERCAAALEAYETGGSPPALRSDDIVTKMFGSTRFGDAYDPDVVDDYLDDVVVALRAHESTSALAALGVEEGIASAVDGGITLSSAAVRGRTFATRGIDALEMTAVDGFLARCADALAAYEGGDGHAGLTADAVLAARLPRASVVLGYDRVEVEDLLGEVAAALRRYEGSR